MMKKITLNIPDNKYSFFIELVKNLGLEKVKDESSENIVDEQNTAIKRVSSLRGKLHLSNEQHREFHQNIKDSRNEWNRGI